MLVGGLEHFLFFRSVGNGITSQLTKSYFSEGWRYTTNQHMQHVFLNKKTWQYNLGQVQLEDVLSDFA